jgi:glutaminyl-tRNA synthetase
LVSIQHALEAEVRLYDRLFIDEAPDSHKEKNFLEFMNPSSLNCEGIVEPSLATAQSGEKFQFQRLGYFNVDKDTVEGKIVFNKTVGLKDALEEKGKEENVLMNTQKKSINM